ncbi:MULTISPECIES: hypothetical protein [Paraburkholderia]|uniref:hypothetical protein n=1 Tax=Paraburkholderia TaxID=1822464 RepID=UPI000376EE78|nr:MULTISPECIES: hypothetical protein [Paraburkholderia]MDH6153279.1 hypothetical protein [Paraburkholderia sp. WSM4179]
MEEPFLKTALTTGAIRKMSFQTGILTSNAASDKLPEHRQPARYLTAHTPAIPAT